MADSLSSRMIVNILGIPGILFLVYLGGAYFAIFIGLVTVLALNEFYGFTRKKGIFPNLQVGILACAMITAYYFIGIEESFFGISLAEIILIFILGILAGELFTGNPNSTSNIAVTFAGIFYIPFLLGALIALRMIPGFDGNFGMKLTSGLFIAVWVCDSAAYAFGKKWGKAKIMERVSPKKTVVGAIAGLFSAILIYQLFLLSGLFEGTLLTTLDTLIMGLIVGVFGQMGDFIESLIKRDAGVKDSSGFLLGHGGVLDRFDSLLFASPLTYLYVSNFVIG